MNLFFDQQGFAEAKAYKKTVSNCWSFVKEFKGLAKNNVFVSLDQQEVR